MQPETATLPTATPNLAKDPGSPSAIRRIRYWLSLFVFWTVLPFILVPLLDMAWGHPVKLPRLPVYLMLQWWVWVPLTPLVAALGRRFPLRQSAIPLEAGKYALVKNALIHLLISWLVAIGLILFLAAMAAVMPVEWSPTQILKQASHFFYGFGAFFQILYWSVLAVSTFTSGRRQRAIVQRPRAQPAA